jgi:hypothetical protein
VLLVAVDLTSRVVNWSIALATVCFAAALIFAVVDVIVSYRSQKLPKQQPTPGQKAGPAQEHGLSDSVKAAAELGKSLKDLKLPAQLLVVGVTLLLIAAGTSIAEVAIKR